MNNTLYNLLLKHAHEYHTVVPFDAAKHKLRKLDFTANNITLTDTILNDTNAFVAYVNGAIGSNFTYGIGGYNEHRTVYSRSHVFDGENEPRRLHLGIDIWGPVGTPVYAPLGGYVHSFAFNDHYGDYGATIILHHQVDGTSFNTLYGHLSLRDLAGLQQGQYVSRGVPFAHFGEPKENGYWPPHLHFQLIQEMHEHDGDYPGVCRYSERAGYLENCPDPDVILQMMKHAV
jgi:peptidoglycan LD-endopeptidase LytH